MLCPKIQLDEQGSSESAQINSLSKFLGLQATWLSSRLAASDAMWFPSAPLKWKSWKCWPPIVACTLAGMSNSGRFSGQCLLGRCPPPTPNSRRVPMAHTWYQPAAKDTPMLNDPWPALPPHSPSWKPAANREFRGAFPAGVAVLVRGCLYLLWVLPPMVSKGAEGRCRALFDGRYEYVD